MADKVNYDSIKINFNEIIKKLHTVALDFASKVDNKIKLENLAFNDSTGEFIGGGQYAIMMKSDDAVQDSDKGRFLKVVQEYVRYFVGEEESTYIKEQDLQPILKSLDAEQIQQNGDQQQDNSLPNALNQDQSQTDTQPQGDGQPALEQPKQLTQESSFVRGGLMNQLFGEAEEGQEAASPLLNDPSLETPSENPLNDQETDQNKTSLDLLIGFAITYDMSVDGKKDTSVSDAIKNKSKGFFGGILADLRNIKLVVGKNTVNVGQIFDPDKWKEAVGIRDIDINTVANNIASSMKVDFPNNDATARVWGQIPLITLLNRNKKLTPEVKSKISSADYSIVVTVNQKDPNYPDYDVDSIAKSVSKAFGTSTNKLVDTNKVSGKDVIKIDDIDNLYKNKSKYEQTSKTVVKEAELKKLVDAETINKSITDTLKLQVEKELKDNVISYGVQSTDEFIQNDYIKDLNDSSFTDSLKKSSKYIIYVNLKREEKKEETPEKQEDSEKPVEKSAEVTKESILVKNLLDILFESDNDIIEADASDTGNKPKDYDNVLKVIKNVFIETKNKLNLGTEIQLNLNIQYRDTMIAGELKEAEEEGATPEQYQIALKNTVGNDVASGSSFDAEVRKMDDIVKELKDKNYEGEFDEIRKFTNGVVLSGDGKINETIDEDRKLLMKFHPDTNGGDNTKIDNAVEKYKGKTVSIDGKNYTISDRNSFYDYIKASKATSEEDLYKELDSSQNGQQLNTQLADQPNTDKQLTPEKDTTTATLNKDEFIKKMNAVIEKFKLKEVGNLFVFKKKVLTNEEKMQVVSSLMESLFDDYMLDEASNYGKGVGINIVKSKGSKNILANIEKMKQWVKTNYLTKKGEPKEQSIRYLTLAKIDEFAKLKTDDEMIEFINAFQDGGKDTSDDRVRTAFIKSMDLVGIPDREDDTAIVPTEYPIATVDGGKLVPKGETNLVPIDTGVVILPFNMPTDEEIKKIPPELLTLKPDEEPEKEEDGKIPATTYVLANPFDTLDVGSGGDKNDWYIIPHKRLKNLADRPHTQSTDNDGVTTTRTSNAEYKP